MNNKKTSSRYIQLFAGSWLIALTLFVLSFVLKVDVLPIYQYILGFAILGIAVVFGSGGFYYIEIESEKDVFRIKYFNLMPVGREFNAMEIPLGRFHKYEVKSKFWGMFHYLYLFEETGRGLAKYPAIGFTALRKDERSIIIEFLDKISR
ncbi:hypothetical protein [Alkalitalea saponilacus]|uniref:Uncharacterized protein n=1 Tax=Alkalitalea saponilacus TaxID=889453 RepID=A0A1T5BX81_9BACT|nr:hypothetical protein [Alkalitalea saponilacus]ASB49570.1 hypothetical protein CDL62_10675 [Alkalitalea saponilacus]SKB51450.1 hypothetical protein SAMN03080601_00656 [Alkalitalea saponilacus]